MKCSSSKFSFSSQARWAMAALTVAIAVTSAPVTARWATLERLAELQARGNGDRDKLALALNRVRESVRPVSRPS
ncbi:MAG: hypothetical protein AAFY15_09135 [Cyanobacteria bacterium J06648_11]